MPKITAAPQDLGLVNTSEGGKRYFAVSIKMRKSKKRTDNWYEVLLVDGSIIETDITAICRWPVNERDERMSIEEIKDMIISSDKDNIKQRRRTAKKENDNVSNE